MLGAGAGQLVGFAAMPFIARLYGPVSFGEQSALISIVGPMAALTSMAYPIAIVVARADNEALSLARLALWGSLILSPAATILLLLNDRWLLRQIGLTEIGGYTVLIPILVVFITMNMSAGYTLTRAGAFGLYSRAQLAAAVVGNISKLAFGFTSSSTLSLIVGNALGYLVVPLMALRLRKEAPLMTARLSISELKGVALRHRDFPLLRAPQNFVAAISQSLPIIGLTAGFGAISAGHYAAALALAAGPIVLIGNAAQSVLYPRLTEAAHAGEDTSRLLRLSTLGLIVVGTPFFVGIAAFGAPIFEILLGSEWREAGFYAALLVPLLWLGLANRPAVSLIPELGLQRGLLVYELLGTAAKVAAIVSGLFVFDDARWTVGLFSAVGALAYFLLIVWVFWENGKNLERRDNENTG